MTIKLFIILFFILIQKNTFSQKGFYKCDSCATLNGEVIDSTTKEPLSFVSVYFESTNSKLGAVTDSVGKYIIRNIPPGEYKIIVLLVGYGKTEQDISFEKNEEKELNFFLIDWFKKIEFEWAAKADTDIANGNIRILLGGLQIANPARDSVAKHYGFYYDLMGCTFVGGELYNEKMYKYLENKYGKYFFKKFYEEVEEYKKNK